jgi:hypothetical protein
MLFKTALLKQRLYSRIEQNGILFYSTNDKYIFKKTTSLI